MKFTASAKSTRKGNDELSFVITLEIDGQILGTLTEKHTYSEDGNDASYRYMVDINSDVTFSHHTRAFQTPRGCAGYTTITAFRDNDECTVTVHHF